MASAATKSGSLSTPRSRPSSLCRIAGSAEPPKERMLAFTNTTNRLSRSTRASPQAVQEHPGHGGDQHDERGVHPQQSEQGETADDEGQGDPAPGVALVVHRFPRQAKA